MCEFCKNGKPIISKTFTTAMDYFGDVVVDEKECIVFVRFDYLCIGDKDDCNCIDHTEHTKIKYCPMCGDPLKGLGDG